MKEQLKKNKANIEYIVKENISKNTPSPTIVAVTKSVDSKTMELLYQAGQRHFAENRPDMLISKKESLSHLGDDIIWHFIGNLQSRPVRKIINDIDYLHSLDRMSLAKEIQKRADKTINCFLQVNVSGENSKSGFKPEELSQTIEDMSQYDKINIVGLMTMAPIDATEEELHQYFGELKSLQENIQKLALPYAPCTELSMGMSQDYPIATQEGATYLRIGSAFFKNI
ncbi:YggS family pyridoxal phosphate-dependent enzyme [Aerococcaceae bacterium WGS1372]